MAVTDRWTKGSQIVMQSVWRDKVVAAWPVTVVEDSAERLVTYLATGTTYRLRTNGNRESSRLPIGNWALADELWTVDLIRIMYPEDHHAYLGFWDATGFSHWYINLEQHYKRTDRGISFVDHFLDIVIDKDLLNWRWKDRRELAQAVAVGLLSEDEAGIIQSEAERALTRLTNLQPPFGEGWEGWNPDPTWPIPMLCAS